MTAAELAKAWSQVERAVAEHSKFPPGALDSSVWSTVASGKVAHRQSDEGVRGVGVIPASREAVWLAVTDDHPVDVVSGLTQVAWNGAWASDKLLYQRLDLPWPFQDRHWVARSQTNLALAGSGAWERAWTNAPDQLPTARTLTDAAAFDAALAIPINRGSWMLVSLTPTDTLAIYQARVQLGGQLPAGAADQYAAVSLPDFYDATLNDARSMSHRYISACIEPDGEGRAIACLGK